MIPAEKIEQLARTYAFTRTQPDFAFHCYRDGFNQAIEMLKEISEDDFLKWECQLFKSGPPQISSRDMYETARLPLQNMISKIQDDYLKHMDHASRIITEMTTANLALTEENRILKANLKASDDLLRDYAEKLDGYSV